MCFGVRFSLYLASWLSDFDNFFAVCVVFGPLVFSPENGGGGQGTLDPPPSPGSAPAEWINLGGLLECFNLCIQIQILYLYICIIIMMIMIMPPTPQDVLLDYSYTFSLYGYGPSEQSIFDVTRWRIFVVRSRIFHVLCSIY